MKSNLLFKTFTLVNKHNKNYKMFTTSDSHKLQTMTEQ